MIRPFFNVPWPSPVAAKRAVAREHLRIWRQARATLTGTSTAGVKTTEMLGRTVAFYSWIDLHHLFDEIFVESCYAFTADTPEPVIIDAGANIGIASLWFTMAYPGARISAIEPEPNAFELLERNRRENSLDRVEPIQAALAEQSGVITLMVDEHRPARMRTSLDGQRVAGASPVEVPAKRLSDLINGPVDLLKLDVEGAEHRVLHEAADSGALSAVNAIIMEYHHHIDPDDDRLGEMLSLLERSGFTYRIDARNFDHSLTREALGKYQDIAVLARRRT